MQLNCENFVKNPVKNYFSGSENSFTLNSYDFCKKFF